ncbi:MAG TPA: oxidoreductase, partial [Bacteroidales bacterium]
MSKLFSPLQIKGITLKNRIAISPMCQYSSKDGFANNFHLVHLGSRAIGGSGLIIQEATAVSPEGRITPGDMGLWDGKQIDKLKEIVQFITEYGSVAGIQLAHAGRKASCAIPLDGGKQIHQNAGGWETVSASALPFYPDDDAPKAMDAVDIEKVVNDFKQAANRALHAGFKIIEVHAAHGYLVHQFLSPLCNQRKDKYGGSFENRIRLVLEIVEAIQAV